MKTGYLSATHDIMLSLKVKTGLSGVSPVDTSILSVRGDIKKLPARKENVFSIALNGCLRKSYYTIAGSSFTVTCFFISIKSPEYNGSFKSIEILSALDEIST